MYVCIWRQDLTTEADIGLLILVPSLLSVEILDRRQCTWPVCFERPGGWLYYVVDFENYRVRTHLWCPSDLTLKLVSVLS